MIEQIDHIGIVVRDLKKGIKLYSEGLGLKVESMEESEGFHTKLAMLPCGEVLIELLEPTGPGMLQDFLNKHGEGLHHIAYKVSNINEALEKASKMFELRDKIPLSGAGGSKIAFLNPASILNVETEFVEK